MPCSQVAHIARLLFILLVVWLAGCDTAVQPLGDEWELPPRDQAAKTGSQLVQQWEGLSLEERDSSIVQEVLSGNVPNWIRALRVVEVDRLEDGTWVDVQLGVLPDYLAVGSSEDFITIPMSPQAAQQIADATDMMLPTPVLVDAIWTQSDVRLDPRPIPPSDAMTSVPVFVEHHHMLQMQRDSVAVPPGAWVAGHKKDVVLSGALNGTTSRVAIYGWHRGDGTPIQQVYVGHTDRWVDYSHGIRLVTRSIRVDGSPVDLAEVLRDEKRSLWFLDDGPLEVAAYSY